MKKGYLRVSTEDQRPDRQIDGLKPLCDEIHIEKVSSTASKRPVFDELFKTLKAGDTLVVWDLDRAFRSTVDAILCADELRQRGITFHIVSLQIDTSEPVGELVYSMVAAIAQFERKNLSKRTKEGLAAAKLRGKTLGRPKKLSAMQIQQAIFKLAEKSASKAELAALYGVHPSTLGRSIQKLKSLPHGLEKV